jgi:hypothetical protein
MIAQDKPDGARSWLSIWEGFDPDNPRLLMLKQKLDLADSFKRLSQP